MKIIQTKVECINCKFILEVKVDEYTKKIFCPQCKKPFPFILNIKEVIDRDLNRSKRI